MRRTCTLLAAGVLTTALIAGLATAAPTPHRGGPSATAAAAGAHGSAGEIQLLDALRARITAARALESATLAAVEQRLRAIYAIPGEDPVIALLAGDITQAQALGELAAAMTRSDEQILSEYTNSLANLQTAQAELAQNMLRINAARRIEKARRAAAQPGTTAHATSAPMVPAIHPPGDGLPSAVANQHTLPGAVPINPHTGRPYGVTGA
jgi:hypothetical protein